MTSFWSSVMSWAARGYHVSKRVYTRNRSFENEFRLQVHFHANQTHFCMKTRFETEAQKVTRRIIYCYIHHPFEKYFWRYTSEDTIPKVRNEKKKKTSTPYFHSVLRVALDRIRINDIRYEPLILSLRHVKFFLKQFLWFLKLWNYFIKWYIRKNVTRINMCKKAPPP